VLTFYQADERSGRPHETWTGTLAPMTSEVRSEQATPAAAAPVRAPMRAPQFAGNGRTAALARGY
jgi:hypothetical protein